ncbi:ABC-type multidrug transport system, ATPase component [Halapricum desulfuricans]|uniref:ABC-type multidrug transport system, ATPase component n=1 Tax=Halapricum desulfuricans TaxID=2841257 RepID=A0A897NAI3_9EURY|nr:ABC-type multidrug transport system, ATPase component [Halapricum desulfuricans]
MTKRYGSGSDAVLALDDLDLTVREGEVFGFLGPNGAGKSTTINVLLDFIEPTAGHAEVLGHDVHSESKAIRARTGARPASNSTSRPSRTASTCSRSTGSGT